MRTIIFEGNTDKQIEPIWDQFVKTHPNGNIFQTSFYFNIFNNNKLIKPIAIILLNKDNDIKGVLAGQIQYILRSPFHFFSSRCIVIGGPLTDKDENTYHQILINELDKYVNHKVVYTQFRNLFDTNSFKKNLTEVNYRYEDHLNIIVDLSLPNKILWSQIHKRRREQINKAIKLGLTFKLIENQEELYHSYKILSSLYKKLGLPLFPYQVFSNALKLGYSAGNANLFGAYYEDKLIGTMFTLCYKKQIYDFFAGSDNHYLHLFPNCFIPWKIFLWGKENGMTIFDWGGAGKPNVPYGVRNYKEKFGGEFVNPGRYVKIHKPIIYYLSKNALAYNRKIKKVLSNFNS